MVFISLAMTTGERESKNQNTVSLTLIVILLHKTSMRVKFRPDVQFSATGSNVQSTCFSE